LSWIAFLSLVDLSQGMLLASINMVAIMIGGRLLFREKFTPLRVAGILLVSAGVAIVGASG
jgi:drug/metabolite transporter (DMT)-like permease